MAENDVLDKDELEELKEFEKLSDHKLLARLAYEIYKLRVSFEFTSIPNTQRVEEYFDYIEQCGDDEILSFDEFRTKKAQNLLKDRLNARNSWEKEDERRRQLNEANKLAALNKVKSYALQNTDWFLPNKPARVNFFWSNPEFAYDWYDWAFNTNGKDVPPKKQKLTKLDIESIIEPIYLKKGNK